MLTRIRVTTGRSLITGDGQHRSIVDGVRVPALSRGCMIETNPWHHHAA